MAQYRATFDTGPRAEFRRMESAIEDCKARLITAANALDDVDGGILGLVDELTGDRLLNLRGETAMAPMANTVKNIASTLPSVSARLRGEGTVYEAAVQRYKQAETGTGTGFMSITLIIASVIQEAIRHIAEQSGQAGQNPPSTPSGANIESEDLSKRTATLSPDIFDGNGKYAYDSFMGVPAYADKRLYDEYWSKNTFYYGDYSNANPPYNNCAEYVNRFYREVYGIDVHGLVQGEKPPSGTHSTSTPQVGDIFASATRGHWAIVKSVNPDGTVTLIEQQQVSDDPGRAGQIRDVVQINRTVNISDGLFFTAK